MRRILLFAVFLLPAQLLWAQFDFGLKAGYNSTKFSAKPDTVDPAAGSGFHAGVFMRIGKKFFVQPEAYYTLQTGKVAGTETAWEQKITMGSVDIPVLAGFRFLNARAVKLRVLAGPVASFVINRNVKDLNDVPGPVRPSDLGDINWGLQAGAGLDLLFLTLDVRYQAGLNSIMKEVGTAGWDSRNNTWLISLGFKLL